MHSVEIIFIISRNPHDGGGKSNRTFFERISCQETGSNNKIWVGFYLQRKLKLRFASSVPSFVFHSWRHRSQSLTSLCTSSIPIPSLRGTSPVHPPVRYLKALL